MVQIANGLGLAHKSLGKASLRGKSWGGNTFKATSRLRARLKSLKNRGHSAPRLLSLLCGIALRFDQLNLLCPYYCSC